MGRDQGWRELTWSWEMGTPQECRILVWKDAMNGSEEHCIPSTHSEKMPWRDRLEWKAVILEGCQC